MVSGIPEPTALAMSDCAILTPPSLSLQSPRKSLDFCEFNQVTRKLGFSRCFLRPRSCSNGTLGKICRGNLANPLSSNFFGQILVVGGAFERNKEVKLSSLGCRNTFEGYFEEIGGERRWHKLNYMQIDGNAGLFGLDNSSGRCQWNVRSHGNGVLANINSRYHTRSLSFGNLDSFGHRSGRNRSIRGILNKVRCDKEVLVVACVKKNWSSGSHEISDENFELKQQSRAELGMALGMEEKVLSRKSAINGVEFHNRRNANDPHSDSSLSSTFDLLELKGELEKTEEVISSGTQEDSDLVPAEDSQMSNMAPEGGDSVERSGSRRKLVLRRSTMLAKQVISMQSALSLGFVSQLWVDTRSWVVLLVEVRPSLLSGEMERFHLEDVCQVGDVVLVQDESVIENEFKMIGLDTLVGYNVVTQGRHNVGKVRGYTFDMNSGAVELLELDSFGISIIPASLVSTYGLSVDDVLEVTSDAVVVHEDAVSRIQRLSKGFWDGRNVEFHGDALRGYSNLGRQPIRSVRRQRSHNDTNGKRFPTKMRETDVDWELPMDY